MDTLMLLSYAGAREVFATLRAYPKRQFTINELAKAAGVPFTTAWKIVAKFELAQLVEVAAIGRSRAVRCKESPYSRRVLEILRLSESHQALALSELKRILKAKKGVQKAYLFGSVALRKERLESDVDIALLVKGKVDLPSLMSAVYEKYGVKVMPLAFDVKHEFEDFLSDKKKVRLV
ncbi:MAG: nucleotidyltransferase domain-containing protein [Candidatus Micrarchaeota archaeon]